MEKVFSEGYDLDFCLTTLNWPQDRELVIGYCRSESRETSEKDFVRQQEIGRKACNRVLGRGRYHILWIAEVGDGDLGAYADETEPEAYRPGFRLVVELLKRGLSGYLVADSTTTISTNPGVHFWLETEILAAVGVDIVTGKTITIDSIPEAISADEKRSERREPRKVSLSRGQMWQISNQLAWTDGDLDEEVANRYGIDPKLLPEIMGRCLYHWDGSVWRSIRPVWEE